MTRLVLSRLWTTVVLLLVVSALTFVLVSLVPGDAARAILGPQASQSQYTALRNQLGLNLSVPEQYARWLWHAVTGDLGTGIFNGQPVGSLVAQRLPVTVSLTAGALGLGLVLGVLGGFVSAVRGGWFGRTLDSLSLLGFAIPSFWAAALLISAFAVYLGWFPVTGYVDFTDSPWQWVQSLTLPVIALGLPSTAAFAMQTRDAVAEVLTSEHVRIARANGLAERAIVWRHALKHASLRIVTVLGVQAIAVLTGSVVIEQIFALPGLGSLTVAAVTQHDLPVLQGAVLVFTVIVAAVNLLTDLSYQYLDPRTAIR